MENNLLDLKPFQLNVFKVKFNTFYNKWQVSKNKTILEEFSTKENARIFCRLNKNN